MPSHLYESNDYILCMKYAQSTHTYQQHINSSYFFHTKLARLPKWYGERPGKKAGDADTPEGEEDVKADEDILDDEDVEEVEEVVEEGTFYENKKLFPQKYPSK